MASPTVATSGWPGPQIVPPAEPTAAEVSSALEPAATVHNVQAAAEGVSTDLTVEFMGERFRIAEDTGVMPLMMFAHSANNASDFGSFESLAAMYAMVRDCIATDAEWRRFVEHASRTKAKADDLMDVVNKTVEVLAARPTAPPGTSSAGRPATSASSRGTGSAATPLPTPPPGRVIPGMEEWVTPEEALASWAS